MSKFKCPAYGPVTTQGILMTVLAGIAAICAFFPLKAQLRARNLPILVLIAVTFLQDVLLAMNAPIWARVRETDWCSGKVLCDIEVKLSVGIDQAIIGGTICIVRQLDLIAKGQGENLLMSDHDEHWNTVLEIFWCLLLPTCRMVLSYVVQPARYGLVRTHGCTMVVYPCWPVLPIYILPPLLGCAAIAWYAISAAREFYRHSREMRSLISYAHSDSETMRILRLSILALILVLFLMPITIYFSILNMCSVFSHSFPYNWSKIHPPGWADKPIKTSDLDPSWVIQDGFYIACGMMMFFFFSTTADTMQVCKTQISEVWAKCSRNMSRFYARASALHRVGRRKVLVEHF